MRPPAPPITILPGALMPEDWLRTEQLEERLPAIGAALAEGRLRMSEAHLPPVTIGSAPPPATTGHATLKQPKQPDQPELPAPSPDAFATNPAPLWAHHRWLAALPAISPLQPATGALSAAGYLLATAQEVNSPPTGATPSPDGHAWLMRPVNFRLTTDSMLMDAMLPASLDEATATRLVAAIRPLLADEGYEIELLTPDAWLLRLRLGMAGWQLHTSAFEATVGQHIDAHLPQGPDARRFRRLLNEIQMSWHLESLHDDRELPVNAVWLDGPISPELSSTLAHLSADGLCRNERFFLPRLYQDLGGWLDQLARLDQWYSRHQQTADAAPFACLLCGEHEARWLYEPAAATVLESWQPALSEQADHESQRVQAAPSQPPGLLRLMLELLSPRAAWQALRELLSAARRPSPKKSTSQGQPALPPRTPAEQMLHTLLSDDPNAAWRV